MTITAAAVDQEHITLPFGLVLKLRGVDRVDHTSGVDCTLCFSILFEYSASFEDAVCYCFSLLL